MLPPVADRFVAGETAATAIDHARALGEDGVGAVLNRLGEHHDDRAAAGADTVAYLDLLRDLEGSGLDAGISVKPSQLGLDVGEGVFREKYRRVVEAAAVRDRVVWCDMEDASTTDATLDAFEVMATAHPGTCGVCVQANLRRTREDVARLAGLPGKVRLVKGAYDEPASVAYTERAEVDESFRELLALLVADHDGGIAAGTHDPAMIEHARDLAEGADADVEFQMLMGVREDAQRALAARGYDVTQYVPYGPEWFPYLYRRVRERRENLGFALRAVLGSRRRAR
ncbi:MAG: proline dehydrogenase family protein [Haloferacaceae archaeon]